MSGIEPFHVMALLARARELESAGQSIIHMEIGEPDFSTPEPVVEAGVRALRGGQTHYTPATGLPALRQKLSDYYQYAYGEVVDPSRIVITPGSSGALQLIMSVLVNAGQNVLMADPGYPCNRHFVQLTGGEASLIPVGPDTGFQLTAETVRQHWNAQSVAVMLATPSNPTGTLIPSAQMAEIANMVHTLGGACIVDEIYHGLVYEGVVRSAANLPGSMFVVNSFSKYFGMTGWRLGWLVAPEAYVDAIDRLSQNLFLSPSTPAQHAALAALEPSTLAIYDQRREVFRERRDYLLGALRSLGFGIPADPQGAFYIYADCSRFTDDSYAFCHQLLEKVGVAVTPGIDFGRNNPSRYIRFAYTTEIEKLKEGIRRLGNAIANQEIG